MQYNAIIIDDEEDAIDLLAHYLDAYFPQIQLVGKAQFSSQIKDVLEEETPDLLFLDVELRHGSGFDVLREMKIPESVTTIFVTGHEKYAVKAFRTNASGYLVKPVMPDLFQKVVRKALTQIDGQRALETSQEELTQQFAIPQSKSFRLTQLSQILYCEAEGAYTAFHLVGEQKIIATKTLGEMEKRLADQGFLRVHQSYLVNRIHIREYDSTDSCIILSNESTVVVSRRQKKIVKNYLQNELMG